MTEFETRTLRIASNIDLIPCVVYLCAGGFFLHSYDDQFEAVKNAQMIYDHLTESEKKRLECFYAGYLQADPDTGLPDLGYGAYFFHDYTDPDDVVTIYNVIKEDI